MIFNLSGEFFFFLIQTSFQYKFDPSESSLFSMQSQ